MAKSWFIKVGQKIHGPITSSQLKELAGQGKLNDSMQIANAKEGPWHPVSHLQGLKVEAAQPAAAATPPDPPAARSVGRRETRSRTNHASGPGNGQSQHPAARSDFGEKLIWKGRPSHLSNLWTYFLCLLFSWLIIPIFVGLWRWLQLQCTRYEVTTERIKESNGVFSKEVHELELYRIKDTAFRQSFVQRLFGLGTITLTTSDTSSPIASMQSIRASKAKRIREDIRSHTERLRDRKRVREVDWS